MRKKITIEMHAHLFNSTSDSDRNITLKDESYNYGTTLLS